MYVLLIKKNVIRNTSCNYNFATFVPLIEISYQPKPTDFFEKLNTLIIAKFVKKEYFTRAILYKTSSLLNLRISEILNRSPC